MYDHSLFLLFIIYTNCIYLYTVIFFNSYSFYFYNNYYYYLKFFNFKYIYFDLRVFGANNEIDNSGYNTEMREIEVENDEILSTVNITEILDGQIGQNINDILGIKLPKIKDVQRTH